MKKVTLSALVLCVLAIVVSCGPRLSTTKMTDKNLENYKTYAYLPSTNFEVSEKLNPNDSKIAPSIIASLNANMERAGYALDRKNPDLLVLLTTMYDKELMKDVEPVYATFPYSRPYRVSPYYSNNYYWDYDTYTTYVGSEIDYSSYEVGTLVVTIIDRKTRNKVWTGTAEQAVFNQNTTEEVAEFVDDIFDEYPTLE